MKGDTLFLKRLIEEETITLESLKEIINNKNDNFKSFGDLLRREIRLKYFTKPFDVNEIIKTCFRNECIKYNEKTLDDWLEGKKKKNHIRSRNYMFKTIFALGLDIKDAINVLKNMKTSFNMRNIEEFIYYVSICNKYSYNQAQMIIKEAKQIENVETVRVTENDLIKNAKQLKTKKETLNFIKSNYSSFNLDYPIVNESNNINIMNILKKEIEKIDIEKYFDEKVYLNQCFKEKNIHFYHSTLDNWFRDKTPKKSDESREHMYKVAFALDLNIEETDRLFRKVYKDRPFNIRRMKEFVYFICIHNHYDYYFAQDVIEEVQQIEPVETSIEPTLQIFNDIHFIHSKEEILNYIKNHYSSFCMNNVSAKAVLDSLKEKIIGKEEKNIIELELSNNPAILKSNHSLTSISGMLTIIYNTDCHSLVSQNSFKDIGLPKEVITNMPTKQTFSKEDPSYEELRKMIILLASYKYWVTTKYSEDEYGLDDYVSEINSYLLDANLSELYPCNQFDFLFLWCSAQDDPLTIFRVIFNDIT